MMENAIEYRSGLNNEDVQYVMNLLSDQGQIDSLRKRGSLVDLILDPDLRAHILINHKNLLLNADEKERLVTFFYIQNSDHFHRFKDTNQALSLELLTENSRLLLLSIQRLCDGETYGFTEVELADALKAEIERSGMGIVIRNFSLFRAVLMSKRLEFGPLQQILLTNPKITARILNEYFEPNNLIFLDGNDVENLINLHYKDENFLSELALSFIIKWYNLHGSQKTKSGEILAKFMHHVRFRNKILDVNGELPALKLFLASQETLGVIFAIRTPLEILQLCKTFVADLFQPDYFSLIGHWLANNAAIEELRLNHKLSDLIKDAELRLAVLLDQDLLLTQAEQNTLFNQLKNENYEKFKELRKTDPALFLKYLAYDQKMSLDYLNAYFSGKGVLLNEDELLFLLDKRINEKGFLNHIPLKKIVADVDKGVISLDPQYSHLYLRLTQNGKAAAHLLNEFANQASFNELKGHVEAVAFSHSKDEKFQKRLSVDFFRKWFAATENDEDKAKILKAFCAAPALKTLLTPPACLPEMRSLLENSKALGILKGSNAIDFVLSLFKGDATFVREVLTNEQHIAAFKKGGAGRKNWSADYSAIVSLISASRTLIGPDIKRHEVYRNLIISLLNLRGNTLLDLFKGKANDLLFPLDPKDPKKHCFDHDEAFCSALLFSGDGKYKFYSESSRFELLDYFIGKEIVRDKWSIFSQKIPPEQSFGYLVLTDEQKIAALSAGECFHILAHYIKQPDFLKTLDENAVFKIALDKMMNDPVVAAQVLSTNLVDPSYNFFDAKYIEESLNFYIDIRITEDFKDEIAEYVRVNLAKFYENVEELIEIKQAGAANDSEAKIRENAENQEMESLVDQLIQLKVSQDESDDSEEDKLARAESHTQALSIDALCVEIAHCEIKKSLLADKKQFVTALKLPFYQANHPVASILRKVDRSLYKEKLYQAAMNDSHLARRVVRQHVMRGLAEAKHLQLGQIRTQPINGPILYKGKQHRFAAIINLHNKADARVKRLEKEEKDTLSSLQAANLLVWHGNELLKRLGNFAVNACVKLIYGDSDPKSGQALEKLKTIPALTVDLESSTKQTVFAPDNMRNMKHCAKIALSSYEGQPLTYEKLKQVPEIWRAMHSKWNTLFTKERWFNSEGMPETMLQLKKVIARLPKNINPHERVSADIIKTLEVIFDDRNRRNSDSTRDKTSHTSRLVAALKSTSTLAEPEPSDKKDQVELALPKLEEVTLEWLEEQIKQIDMVRKELSDKGILSAYTSRESHSILNTFYQLLRSFQNKSCHSNFKEWTMQHGMTTYFNSNKCCAIHFENFPSWEICQSHMTKLIYQFITSRYVFKSTGHEKIFFDSCTRNMNHCIEGKTASVCYQAGLRSSQSTIQSFIELIQSCLEKALAYMETMGLDANRQSLADFISKRYAGKLFSIGESAVGEIKSTYKVKVLPDSILTASLNRDNIGWYLERNGYPEIENTLDYIPK